MCSRLASPSSVIWSTQGGKDLEVRQLTVPRCLQVVEGGFQCSARDHQFRSTQHLQSDRVRQGDKLHLNREAQELKGREG